MSDKDTERTSDSERVVRNRASEESTSWADQHDLLSQANHFGPLAPFLLTEATAELSIPVFVIDQNHQIIVWNKALARLTGLDAERMCCTCDSWRAFHTQPRPTLADLIVDGTVDQKVEKLYHGKYHRSPLVEGGIEVCDFFPCLGPDGLWLHFTAAPLKNADGQIVGAIEILLDVTARHHTEALLLESQGFLRQIVYCSSVSTFVIDREHRLTHWNRACELITGHSAQKMVGTRNQWQPFYESQRPVFADLILESAVDESVSRYYKGKFRPSTVLDGAYEIEDFFPHLGESGLWLFFTAAPLHDVEGNLIGAIETLQDITERKRAEEALRESERLHRTMSITDALTSLFNARHFHERLKIETERARRYHRTLSLLVIDLDNFKQLNDTFGHLEGDQALATTGAVIRRCLRGLDAAFRYGGEEFALLLPETDLAGAVRLAERLRRCLAEEPLTTAAGIPLKITASISATELSEPETEDSLIRRADQGVYLAKQGGKNQVVPVPAKGRNAHARFGEVRGPWNLDPSPS
ncbi:sensor domain-containing diguanylate cyclase [Candidatus Accumulibacter phosphatis]|uniref:sensor domain-containing diguanylate cyclase n=1 Tax=Candidatus Accumulibacter phosphatis TaxID=327160 RepID=UPI00110B65DE|nr:diguanylate cyclase [Candidatus Accumulibacter phosphatis]